MIGIFSKAIPLQKNNPRLCASIFSYSVEIVSAFQAINQRIIKTTI
jgi:hypothetical protein